MIALIILDDGFVYPYTRDMDGTGAHWPATMDGGAQRLCANGNALKQTNTSAPLLPPVLPGRSNVIIAWLFHVAMVCSHPTPPVLWPSLPPQSPSCSLGLQPDPHCPSLGTGGSMARLLRWRTKVKWERSWLMRSPRLLRDCMRSRPGTWSVSPCWSGATVAAFATYVHHPLEQRQQSPWSSPHGYCSSLRGAHRGANVGNGTFGRQHS